MGRGEAMILGLISRKYRGRFLPMMAAILFMPISIAAANPAANIDVWVGWKTTEINKATLQTAEQGSLEFTAEGEKYIISHQANHFGDRAKIILEFGNSSAAIPVYSSRGMRRFGFTIDVQLPDRCASSFITQLTRRADGARTIDAAISAIVQAQLMENAGCPNREMGRLNFVKAAAGCRLTELNDFLTAELTDSPAYNRRINRCIGNQRARLATKLIRSFKKASQLRDYSGFTNLLAEMESYQENDEWQQTFETLNFSAIDANHSHIQLLYTLALNHRKKGDLETASTYSNILAEKAQTANLGEKNYQWAFKRADLKPAAAININDGILARIEKANIAENPVSEMQ